MKKPNVICFGEMLWDKMPDQISPGGAPFNVTLNLIRMGVPTKLLSKVGNDLPGEDILKYFKKNGGETDLIQIDEKFPTSTVEANWSENNEIKYHICENVAWDYIQFNETVEKVIKETDVLVYGSLAARNSVSCHTLERLLEYDLKKVFDVNLRKPHYSKALLNRLLGKADLVKVNKEELLILSEMFQVSGNEISLLNNFSKKFTIPCLCVTEGESGAFIFHKGKKYSHPGFKVQVQDTIGCGDAFFSGFLKMFLEGKSIEESLEFACGIGAYLSTKRGGNPPINFKQINNLMKH
ncbi:MAG: carbohydrate kinase [Flammeovirgaceae bacterium]|nr:carbohydrate kinase [Flammeovirgaceae bacterium]